MRVLGTIKKARAATMTFIGFGCDKGGEYAIVQGPHGQRCLTVDRIRPANRRNLV